MAAEGLKLKQGHNRKQKLETFLYLCKDSQSSRSKLSKHNLCINWTGTGKTLTSPVDTEISFGFLYFLVCFSPSPHECECLIPMNEKCTSDSCPTPPSSGRCGLNTTNTEQLSFQSWSSVSNWTLTRFLNVAHSRSRMFTIDKCQALT